MMLWTAQEAAKATSGRATGDWGCLGISIDTRTLAKGDLFVALKAVRDGHEFVAQALANGAAAALVSRIPEGVAEDAPLLLVDDVQAGLEDLGRAARARMAGKVVAVTGSVGKTSTKEMLRSTLSGQGRTHAAEASYNNHWGVPLTLARMPRDTEFAVIEIGMSNPGEIAPLAKMARPHVAIITTVAPAHLAAFENIEGIAHEKASIFDGLEPDGTAIFNGDLPVTPILKAKAAQHAKRLVSFGQSPGLSYQLTAATVGKSATVAEASHRKSPLLFKVAAPGAHYAMNALAVLAAAQALGLDRAIALGDLAAWQPGAGRGHREVIALDKADPTPTIELIDDAYNANPASLEASLNVLASAAVTDDIGRVRQGRRIAYLGDMKELGPQEVALHQAVADYPAMAKIHRVHCVGPLMKALHARLPEHQRGRWTETADDMTQRLAQDLDAGDVVLAKGSLSMGMARVVDAIRNLGHPAPDTNEGNS
ncbi:UDP-N-acetylmuramoyl-tripeptide--D-alanyl-D-alanine ligase [Cognatishimia sp. SS12]|uniref:UDP-N-acetylmuramoyl-tripeptide--D-alanyl-D- alanine ligase n=1 Tax=Cognatishimia sp. SS12 TaxID=2979465 RepID=UPI00232F8C6E|nr:UDP-N-acetylmuramoyl-tripeptide--D-alanyl-D-alanine ligase [Cognatishimia sp. SS12]MDC0736925.1 UDP-N-acetylmuramoyl-tripeptide--D-alanyl-D-alanine ligase [Cognatishimia sp. SS12]